MRYPAFFAFGLGFVLMGAGLFALTMRKAKGATLVNPSKTQLREKAALDAETRKMRLGAGLAVGLGAVLCVIAFT